MKILLVIPPFTQINTLYPSVGQLAGFLTHKGYDAKCLDLSLKVILRIFSSEGLKQIFAVKSSTRNDNPFISRINSLSEEYINIIEPVVNYLQGKNPNMAHRIVQEGFLPHSESFNSVKEEEAFGYFSVQDKAKYYCSLVIDDLTKYINKTITPHFGLSRYAEKISASLSSFEPLKKELKRPYNLIEEFITEQTAKVINEFNPAVIGFSIPFPGNLLGALVSSKYIRMNYPEIKIICGGGYINTELRTLRDPEIFKYTDFITLDDGELPLLNILRNFSESEKQYVRTFVNINNKVVWLDDADTKILQHNDLFPPVLNGIDPDEYISMTEMLNPMHRLWSDGYWNKLAVAHGCYWKKCTFCDITLDYINRYSPARVNTIINWIEDLISKTGRTAFHFTDEAAPPALLKELAIEIIRRKLQITWWGNIRFEKSFTSDLCRLMAASGCIAVSGGLEIADERLLRLINKGVTIEQTAKVCSNFQKAGIMVHAYLMYGFPTQTEQEIVNSLELVRQFMKLNLFQSAFWHRFSLTAHSPIAQDPAKYKIEVHSYDNKSFAVNDLTYADESELNYDLYSAGLNKALYNYMNGIGLDWHVKEWFDIEIPRPTVTPRQIETALQKQEKEKQGTKLIWISGKPILIEKENQSEIIINTNQIEGEWNIHPEEGRWLLSIYEKSRKENLTLSNIQETFPGTKAQYENFIQSTMWKELRANVIIIV